MALIFTPDVLAAAAHAKPFTGPLLLRWASCPEDQGGPALRSQLERSAALVDDDQRARVLGPLQSLSSSDDQVRTAAAAILLAKTLHDLGWQLEFEPDVDGGTPDLSIRKGDEQYWVEIRRVIGHARDPMAAAIARIRDALTSVTTHTPIFIRSASVPGNASLKPFVRHLKALFASAPGPGRHTFHEGNVLVVFDTHAPFAAPMPAVGGWSGFGSSRGEHEDVREHLNEKLMKYKVPLIIALDFVDALHPFDATGDALLGQTVIRVPIAPGDNAEPAEAQPGRNTDGLVLRGGADGDRARNRLQAVLPFYLSLTDEGSYAVRARILANPATTTPSSLASFAPIPRLVVVEETAAERSMQYLDEHDQVVDPEVVSWRHVP